jgi:hypothetical protein
MRGITGREPEPRTLMHMHPGLSWLQRSIDGQGESTTKTQNGATEALFERFMA